MLNSRLKLLIGVAIPAAAVHFAAAGFVWAADGGPAPIGPKFSLPIGCAIGTSCFLQSHVDLVAGDGVGDHACGAATYDGHKGTDFRVLSAAATNDGGGVPVLAAAAGRVRGVRDGMTDIFLRDAAGRDGAHGQQLKGRECGNGLVLDHGGGWETQYCHLKRGSVLVGKGQTVQAGDRLGSVGYSGKADFAHLHFEVRKDGKTVDPFLAATVGSGASDGAQCDLRARSGGRISASGLWDEDAQQQVVYLTGVILGAGFAGRTLGSAELERDHELEPPRPDSGALVFLVRAMNLERGDLIRLRVSGPAGFSVSSDGDPVEPAKAVWVAYAGKRLKAARWPAGTYTGEGEVVRGGRVVSSRQSRFEMR